MFWAPDGVVVTTGSGFTRTATGVDVFEQLFASVTVTV
jgi:hypothetical protein